MALDRQHIPTKMFEEYFVDKDTGCPLAGGVVKFFRDVARTTPKDVWILSGTVPNYSYTNIGDTVTLSSVGTFEYQNQDVTVYLLPYDDSGNIDLYYATVESSGAVFQFSREAFPNVIAGEEDEAELENFIANGQFKLHHDIPADDAASTLAGQITEAVTVVAEGGWAFERPGDSTATDFVNFERFGSFVETPSKSPRYSVRVKNTGTGSGDLYKRLTLTYRDVNKFSSDTEFFTFAFQAKSNTGSSSDITVTLIKNYGEGGSAEEETVLQSIALSTDYTIYDIPFVFGSNDGKTIGSGDDDFLQLVISFPVANVFDDSFDNFLLTKGDKQVTAFPDTTDAEFLRDSLAGQIPIPDYSNLNLYLPILLGPKGFLYDSSIIGDYVIKSFNALEIGELWCDGNKYSSGDVSSDEIPYLRLYNRWSQKSDVGLAIYGPGDDEMIFNHKGTGLDQEFTSIKDLLGTLGDLAWQSFTAGATGNLTSVAFAINKQTLCEMKIYSGEGTGGSLLLTQNVTTKGGRQWNTVSLSSAVAVTATQKYTISLRRLSGRILDGLEWCGSFQGGYAGGRFWSSATQDGSFKTWVDSTTSDVYRMSSVTNGLVTPAADGATPTGFTFTPVQPGSPTTPYIVDITPLAGSSLSGGEYWTYDTTDSRHYVIWYTVDGSGTKPAEAAAVYRQVDVLSTDDAQNVGNKTAVAVNSVSYKVPDWRGYFMRVTDDGAGVDLDVLTRTDRGDGVDKDHVGTVQDDVLFPSGTGNIDVPNKYIKLAVKY